MKNKDTIVNEMLADTVSTFILLRNALELDGGLQDDLAMFRAVVDDIDDIIEDLRSAYNL